MKRFGRSLLLLICAVAIGVGGFLAGRRSIPTETAADSSPPDSQPSEPAATATVKIVPLRRKTISQSIVAYGTVVAQPGEVKIASVPFESRVLHLRVTAGQPVIAGTALLTIEPSADAQLQLQQAQNAVDQSNVAFKQAQQRFTEKLATNQDMSQAKEAVENAQLNLKSLKSRGIGAETTLHAEQAGEVAKVDVQEGQVVATGAAMVELIAANRIEVRFGIEPDDASNLRAGQHVAISSVRTPATQPSDGVLRLITNAINPDTRLVDAFATIPEGSIFLLADYVRGGIAVESKEGLVIPRSAVLPGDDDQLEMFTVRDGRAVRHIVQVGLRSGDEIEVEGDGLKEGDPVVITGNYELEDGMSVVVGKTE